MEIESSIRWVALPEEPPRLGNLFVRRLQEIFTRKEGPRGLDWILRKHEIPFDELLSIENRAYPNLQQNVSRAIWEVERAILQLLNPLFSRLREYGAFNDRQRRVELLLRHLHDSPEMLRIADWTAALMLAFDEEQIAKTVPDMDMTSIGIGKDEISGKPVFGVFVYAKEGNYPYSETNYIKIDEYIFPIIVRRGYWLRDSVEDVHPINGTATCGAVSEQLSETPRKGFLTAAHLLSPASVGALVQTRSGPGKVLALAPPGIDAMLVSPSDGALQQLSLQQQIIPQQPVVPYTPVEFCGTSSGCVTTAVTEVTNLFGTLSPRIPARVILAHAGKGGDSGALIRSRSNYGVGLYTDRFIDVAGVEHGMGMHLAQVAHSMSLTLYEL
jgi:hypothetical protein